MKMAAKTTRNTEIGCRLKQKTYIASRTLVSCYLGRQVSIESRDNIEKAKFTAFKDEDLHLNLKKSANAKY